MKKRVVIFLLVSVTFLLNGCAKRGEKMLAKVNDKSITLREFNKRVERLPKSYQEIIKGQRRQFLEDLIDEELLYEEALKSKIDKNPETQEVIAEAKKKILISRLIKERADDKISIPERDIEKYYNEHSEDFMLPERWRASHILVDTPEEAEQIKQKINQGESFENLAKEKSKDAAAKQGGDVGYFTKGQLIPEFEQACFGLEVGEISGIVKTKFGYHIIKLTERKNPEVQNFSAVKDLIKKEMEREQKKKLLQELMANLKNSARITINEKFFEESTAPTDKEPEVSEKNK